MVTKIEAGMAKVSKQRDVQTDRQTDSQKDRQTDGQAGRQAVEEQNS